MKNLRLVLITLFSQAICGCTTSVSVAQLAGKKFYENLDLLPYVDMRTEVQYASSFDRTGANDDGFSGTYSALYVDENGEHVLFDQQGPGCVYTLYFAGNIDARLKFYFDHEKNPRLDHDIMEYFSGEIKPFAYPLIYHRYQSTGSYSSAVPIEFSNHLKITTDNRIGFYNIYSQTYQENGMESFKVNHDFSRLSLLFNQCGAGLMKDPADTIVRTTVDLDSRKLDESIELFSQQGEGMVQYILINPLFEPDPFDLNHVYIRVYYDGRTTPAIEAPLGFFFGSGLGETSVRSLFIGMSPSDQYYCYLPMPFFQGISIELINKKYNLSHYPKSYEEFYVEIGVSRKPLRHIRTYQIGYLGAKYNHAYPATGNDNYELFAFEGAGALVGQVVTIEPVHPDVKQWWEGDLFVYIDGEEGPRIHGTGHEEDLSMGGWSSLWMLNPFSLPLSGAPKSNDLKMIEGQINGSCTTYRFWPGKIPFRNAVHMSIEHGSNNNRTANYSSLVFYYYIPTVLGD